MLTNTYTLTWKGGNKTHIHTHIYTHILRKEASVMACRSTGNSLNDFFSFQKGGKRDVWDTIDHALQAGGSDKTSLPRWRQARPRPSCGAVPCCVQRHPAEKPLCLKWERSGAAWQFAVEVLRDPVYSVTDWAGDLDIETPVEGWLQSECENWVVVEQETDVEW